MSMIDGVALSSASGGQELLKLARLTRVHCIINSRSGRRFVTKLMGG